MQLIMIVIFRRISSDTAKEWLKHLKKKEVPVIVCLTHADMLYAECVDESGDPKPTEEKKKKIGSDLNVYDDCNLCSIIPLASPSEDVPSACGWVCSSRHTVEPPNSGHHWDPVFCPL